MRASGLWRLTTCVAIVCVVVLGVSSYAGARSAQEVNELLDSATDADVFMDVKATPDQVSSVARAIRSSNLVERYAHLSHADALQAFKQFLTDHGDAVSLLARSDLPESFRVDFAKHTSRDAAVSAFGSLPGVSDVKFDRSTDGPGILDQPQACDSPTGVLEVFMEVGATSRQLSAVRGALTSPKNVIAYRFLDHDEAYSEAERLGIKVKKIKPEDLPESFRVFVARANEASLTIVLEALPGVGTIIPSSHHCRPPGVS